MLYAYYSLDNRLDENGYGVDVRLFDVKNNLVSFRPFATRDEADDYIQELRDCGELDNC